MAYPNYRQQGWGTLGSYMLTLVFMYFILITSSQAFAILGFSPLLAIGVLFLAILTSSINIPLTTIESEKPITKHRQVRFFGINYQIPITQSRSKTMIAINVGGAVIPILISLYLIFRQPIIGLYAIPSVFLTSIGVNYFAKPVKGVGIAIPSIVPAFLTIVSTIAVTFNNTNIAPVVAYITGTLGSLIGADILNLKKIPELGAPIASIGGAGTFDGVFISGVFSVILLVFLGYV